MKVLIDHGFPFLLAHGGFQIQIEQTLRALLAEGLDAQRLEWWNDKQSADLIHYFGAPPAHYFLAAQAKGIKVVVSDLRSGLGARAAWLRLPQQALIRTTQEILPVAISRRLGWMSYRMADGVVALTPWEAHLMQTVFGCPPENLHVIPNGVESEFFDRTPVEKAEWLISTATIHPRKRVLELAKAAVLARIQIRFIGRPYSQDDPYYQAFRHVALEHPEFVDYIGPVQDRNQMAAAYRAARGFVLISSTEGLSLAALEAAASGCPLLLTDLPWARVTFGEAARYCPNSGSPRVIAAALENFKVNNSQSLPHYQPLTWADVARKLGGLYGSLVSPA